MARVNLDPQVFAEARLSHMARIMNWSLPTTLGTMAFLWHDSQELGKAEATSQELWVWSRADCEKERLISALSQVGYISEIGENLFEIRGNRKHIKNIFDLKKRSRKANAAKRKRPTKEKGETNQQDVLAPTRSLDGDLKHGFRGYNAVQCSTMQFNTKQNKEKEEKLPAAIPGSSVSRVIATYCQAYKDKYKISIRLSGKDVGILKRLVASIGEDRLSDLVQVYLQIENKWFETKHYDLATFEQNLNEVQVALGTGMSTKQRKKAESDKFIFGEEDGSGNIQIAND